MKWFGCCSSGAHGVLLMLRMCKSVSLYGFTTYPSKRTTKDQYTGRSKRHPDGEWWHDFEGVLLSSSVDVLHVQSCALCFTQVPFIHGSMLTTSPALLPTGTALHFVGTTSTGNLQKARQTRTVQHGFFISQTVPNVRCACKANITPVCSVDTPTKVPVDS